MPVLDNDAPEALRCGCRNGRVRLEGFSDGERLQDGRLSRRVFEQKVSSPEDLANFGNAEEKELAEAAGREQELLVIAKRGRAAKIEEPGFTPDELKGNLLPGMTWADIRPQSADLPEYEEEDDEEDEDDDEDEDNDCLGEYGWTYTW